MKNKIYKNIYFILGIVLIIILWEIISLITHNELLPEFFLCFSNMFQKLFSTNIIIDAVLSLVRLLIAFIISSIIGVSLGILSGLSKKTEIILQPLTTILRAIPTIAFVFILIIYAKFSYIYIVSILISPIIYQATTSAIKKQYSLYKNLLIMKEEKISISTIFKLLIPAASSDIFNSFIQTLSLGFKAQILAESFSYRSSFRGLGKLIYNEYYSFNILNMMSYILLSLFIALMIDLGLNLIKRVIDKRINAKY